jgi:hypothetical protein
MAPDTSIDAVGDRLHDKPRPTFAVKRAPVAAYPQGCFSCSCRMEYHVAVYSNMSCKRM